VSTTRGSNAYHRRRGLTNAKQLPGAEAGSPPPQQIPTAAADETASTTVEERPFRAALLAKKLPGL